MRSRHATNAGTRRRRGAFFNDRPTASRCIPRRPRIGARSCGSCGSWTTLSVNSVLSVAEPGRRQELSAGVPAVSRKYGILVVDDQADLRAMLRIALEEEDFAVWLAGNGREAFDVYRSDRKMIDVVLLDINSTPGVPSLVNAITL